MRLAGHLRVLARESVRNPDRHALLVPVGMQRGRHLARSRKPYRLEPAPPGSDCAARQVAMLKSIGALNVFSPVGELAVRVEHSVQLRHAACGTLGFEDILQGEESWRSS